MVVPTPRGERNALVLAAACVAGVDRAFTIGGAPGGRPRWPTARPRCRAVDKITGPGNAYVASAKRRVFGKVGIDMIAGPSEILVLADGTTPPGLGRDGPLQPGRARRDGAEHPAVPRRRLHRRSAREAIDRLLPGMPRHDVIRASLEGRGALIQHALHGRGRARSATASRPEHLEVSSSADPHRWEPLLRHAGAIFLGAFTSESLGDYCAGPNHVLPTSGTARFSSPLGVYDFQKRSSLIEVSEAGAQKLGPIAAELAYSEGLQAHARAAELRLKDTSHEPPTSTPASSAVVRQDVQSMHGYAIQPSAGFVKLDAMENPFRLPEPLQAELGAAAWARWR